MLKINPTKIRNFSIIAHIDHGKSTLADRFLELTNLKNSNKPLNRLLDSLVLEQEKGITIKLNAVQLYYPPETTEPYIFNLIDTPGHFDFHSEVSRSLATCEGVILLVDAIKGIQAQTLNYYEIARKQGLKIIPTINKIDLPHAQTEKVQDQLIQLLACSREDICLVSAKTGKNVDLLFQRIIEKIPAPIEKKGHLKALVFDLLYNQYQGVIIYVRIFEGELAKKQKIKFLSNQKVYQIEKLGVKIPQEISKDQLVTGEIGWFAANIRDIRDVQVGDTVTDIESNDFPLLGYQKLKPNIYSNLYPNNSSQFNEFKKAIEELQLQDSALSLEVVESPLLGPGFRCGFLGLLHREIVQERISQEYNLELILTPPTINYRLILGNGTSLELSNPQKMPAWQEIKSIEELFIQLNITAPQEYLGAIMELCQIKRGIHQANELKTDIWWEVVYELPFAEFILDFTDQLKSISRGFASFDYQFLGFRPSRIVRVDILLNQQPVEDLAFLVHQAFAYDRSKKLCEELKETLNPQNFVVPIQACIGGKVIARETLSALRKNVTGKCYGGDITRKKKLWAKQAKGKKKMQSHGKVQFSGGTLRNLLERRK